MVKDTHSAGTQRNQDGDDQPGEPLSFVVLRTSVYLMGVMLIVGFAFLIYALVDRAGQLGSSTVPDDIEARISLSSTEQIGSIAVDRNTLAVQVTDASGSERIVVLDLVSNRIVKRIAIERKSGN